jgi:hypothetical protein
MEVRRRVLHLSCQWSCASSSPPTKAIAPKDSSRFSEELSAGRAGGAPTVGGSAPADAERDAERDAGDVDAPPGL